MSKKKNDRNLKRPEPQPLPSDYDLNRALNAIRKGTSIPYDSIEGTKTEVKIGSVSFNVWSNSGASSETDSQLGDKYVTEKYVESIVNNLKADQTNSSTQLIELFNGKLDAQNEKIESFKEKCLTNVGFWSGISIVGVLVGLIATFVVSYVQDYKEGLRGVETSVKENSRRIEKIEEKVDSLHNVVLVNQKQLEKSQKKRQ